VPLYIYPTQGAWQPLIAAKQANPGPTVLAIVNPGSGPGTRTDPNYVTGISALKGAGIQTLAYVPTLYGKRSHVEVSNDIDAYSTLYGRVFDGLFLDEMARDAPDYYERISSYSKQNGYGMVVGNPGTDVSKDYIGRAADAFVIYENAGVPSPSFLNGWHSGYAKKTWAFIAHHVLTLDPDLVAQNRDQVGLLYLTDSNYHSFPPYLAQLIALL